jgi:hypothetical protein
MFYMYTLNAINATFARDMFDFIKAMSSIDMVSSFTFFASNINDRCAFVLLSLRFYFFLLPPPPLLGPGIGGLFSSSVGDGESVGRDLALTTTRR